MNRSGIFIALLSLFVTLTVSSETALAQKKKSSQNKKASNATKVVVSFEEDLVEGNMTGAELFLILQKKQTRFESLFQLRQNFKDKLYENAEGVE